MKELVVEPQLIKRAGHKTRAEAAKAYTILQPVVPDSSDVESLVVKVAVELSVGASVSLKGSSVVLLAMDIPFPSELDAALASLVDPAGY